MDAKELAKAFEEEKPKKKVFPIVALTVGLALLVLGVTFLVVKIVSQSSKDTAERLVEIGTFVKEGEEKVVWQFTEIGKGTLTTDGHENDYNFIWALEGDTLKVETEWLYDLEDEFKYKFDGDKLVLDEKVIFVPAN